MVDLGDRGHGGFLASLAEALLDGYGRGNSQKEVHIGAGHHLYELTGIGGKTIDVTPLPLGIDDIKGQGRFSRTA